MLELEDLTVRFGGLKALDGVGFRVDPGEIVGLIGPNGAGKTTLFNAISRFVHAQSGSITFEGQDLLRLAPHRIISAGIARTFQNLSLFPLLTVKENLLVGQHHHFGALPWEYLYRSRRVRRQERELAVEPLEMLGRLGLEALQDAYVMALPYGTQKFVEACRALSMKPRLVLLDEPVAGLTSAETEQMHQLILRARDEFEVTVLLIEHDMELVMGTCDRVIALDFGRMIAQGTPSEIQDHPQVIEAYLGRAEGDADA